MSISGTNKSPESMNQSGEPSPEQTVSPEPETDVLAGLDMNVEPTRTNYTKLLEELENIYQQNPDDIEVALAYAEKLLEMGDIAKSEEVLKRMLASEVPHPQAIYLSAQISYISGNYVQAEKLYNILMDKLWRGYCSAMVGARSL